MTIRLTRDEALQPFPVTCAQCGMNATAYAYPMPKGSVWCPRCSPAWLKAFLEFATKQ